MELLTASPEHIGKNIALASLYGGLPVGIVTALYALMIDNKIAGLPEISQELIATIVLLPVACFMCGMVLVAPALYILRHFGLAGPAFVYGIGFFTGCSFFGLSPQAGFYVLVVAIICSHIFCRLAYQGDSVTVAE